MTWIAVVGNGSWGASTSKVHAALAGSGEVPKFSLSRYYTARCGVRYLTEYADRFDDVMNIEKCQRCTKLLKEGTQ